jgi:hypothetical protein
MANEQKSGIAGRWHNLEHEMEALRTNPAALTLLRGVARLNQDRLDTLLITLPTLPEPKEGAEHGKS